MTQDTKREALIAGLSLVRRHHELTRDDIDEAMWARKTARGCILLLDDAITALSTHPTPTAEQGGEALRLIEMCRERGDFVRGDDGFWMFWPSQGGALTGWMVAAIGAELKRLNEPVEAEWDARVATLTKSNGGQGGEEIGLREAASDLLSAQRGDERTVGYRYDLWKILDAILSEGGR